MDFPTEKVSGLQESKFGETNAGRRCKRGTAMQTRDGDANSKTRGGRGKESII